MTKIGQNCNFCFVKIGKNWLLNEQNRKRTVYNLVTVLSHLFDALLQVTGKSAAKLILSVDARQKVRKQPSFRRK